MRFRILVIVAAFLGLLPASAQAQAPVQCLEGRTAAGACVDVSLGSMMRERVRVFTQPRLSYTGPAILPSRFHQYDALRDWGQGLRGEIYGPCVAKFCP